MDFPTARSTLWAASRTVTPRPQQTIIRTMRETAPRPSTLPHPPRSLLAAASRYPNCGPGGETPGRPFLGEPRKPLPHAALVEDHHTTRFDIIIPGPETQSDTDAVALWDQTGYFIDTAVARMERGEAFSIMLGRLQQELRDV